MAAPKLLDLPPEVRNLIYIAYLNLHGDAVYISAARRLITRGPLLKINQQIRNESESLVDLHARNITFPVYDFKFGCLVTFLNKLDKLALDALAAQPAETSNIPATTYSKLKRFNIQLHFSKEEPGSSRGYLERWIRRFDKPEKKGTAVDFEYEVIGMFPSIELADHMLAWLIRGGHHKLVAPGEKGIQHARTMWEAMKAARKVAASAQWTLGDGPGGAERLYG